MVFNISAVGIGCDQFNGVNEVLSGLSHPLIIHSVFFFIAY